MAKRDIDNSPPVGLWPLALGAVGFVCGFFGPIALNPDANQGPLLGIFITGPGGALLGLVAGVIARFLPLTDTQRWRALGILCITSAVVILFICLPRPQLRSRLVDAEVRGCESPVQAADAATKEWEASVAKVTWAPPRKGWRNDVARMMQADPGVVLEVQVVRTRDIFENRKPWNRGTRFAGPWRESSESEHFYARFAGTSCDAYLRMPRQRYLPTSDASSAWPPDLLPNYLGLQVLGAVPAEDEEFAATR